MSDRWVGQLAAFAAIFGGVAQMLPGWPRACLALVCGLAIPAYLLQRVLKVALPGMHDESLWGLSGVIVLCWWLLASLTLLWVGLPLNRFSAWLVLAVANVVPAGIGRGVASRRFGHAPPLPPSFPPT